jgi:hypothetical protein
MYVSNTPTNSDNWTKSSRTYSIQFGRVGDPEGRVKLLDLLDLLV